MARDGFSPRDLGLRSASFTTMDRDDVRRVIMNVEAGPKVGKTDFCLRGTPAPIVIFNFDQGLRYVVKKIRRLGKGKNIIVAGMAGSGLKDGYPSYSFARAVQSKGEKRESYLDRTRELAKPIWLQWIDDLKEFYKSDARTGVIDTATAAYVLGKFAHVGTDQKRQTDDPYGKQTGVLNALFQGLMTEGQSHNKNMLWVHRVKEEWRDNKPTGRYKTAGYIDAAYEVEVTVRLRMKDGKRSAEVRNCRMDEEMNGEIFSKRKEIDFSYIMAAITGTDQHEWQ